jgi:anti-sigma factor RsiW
MTMNTRHLSDEDLLLDYYGEATAGQRAEIREHLKACAECRALDRELRGVLALVASEPVPEAPVGFEQQMWARIEPHIQATGETAFTRPAVGLRPDTTLWRFEFPRWGLAASAAALAVASFWLGRVWDAPAPSVATVTDARAVSERMLRNEVEEHLERSQRVLLELANADDSAPVVLAGNRERAADLVAAGRLYRRSVEDIGDAETRDLLEAVERVLVEIANGPDVESSNDLSEVRARISDQDLIFRLRLMTAEMRAREQRARPTW